MDTIKLCFTKSLGPHYFRECLFPMVFGHAYHVCGPCLFIGLRKQEHAQSHGLRDAISCQLICFMYLSVLQNSFEAQDDHKTDGNVDEYSRDCLVSRSVLLVLCTSPCVLLPHLFLHGSHTSGCRGEKHFLPEGKLPTKKQKIWLEIHNINSP